MIINPDEIRDLAGAREAIRQLLNIVDPSFRFFRSFGASGIRADLLLWNVYGKARDSTMSTF